MLFVSDTAELIQSFIVMAFHLWRSAFSTPAGTGIQGNKQSNMMLT
jgi:hypothetical protein